MSDEGESLVFRVRALAQAHPLSSPAHRYVNAIVARERTSQPQADIGIWAGHALTAGYCLRRLEEVEVTGERWDHHDEIGFAELDGRASEVAAAVRTTGAEHLHLMAESEVVAALDELIAGEIDRRLDHWRGTVDEAAWHQLEEYIAWWTVKGYALRIAETTPVVTGGEG